jgi:hypothetical protein
VSLLAAVDKRDKFRFFVKPVDEKTVRRLLQLCLVGSG